MSKSSVETPPRPPVADTDNEIQPHSHTGEEKVLKRRKAGRPRGAVENKAIREAMKRKFGRVVTPQKFGKLIELIYDQAMEGEKQSQKLLFDYGLPKDLLDSDNKGSMNVQIVINDMVPKEIEINPGDED